MVAGFRAGEVPGKGVDAEVALLLCGAVAVGAELAGELNDWLGRRVG